MKKIFVLLFSICVPVYLSISIIAASGTAVEDQMPEVNKPTPGDLNSSTFQVSIQEKSPQITLEAITR